MRLTTIGVALLACLAIAACSTGGGGESPYAPPNMGTAADLTDGNPTYAAATVDEAVVMLQGAMGGVDTFVTATPRRIPAKTITLLNGTDHVDFSGATPEVAATGFAELTYENVPFSDDPTADAGVAVNGSMTIKQEMTVIVTNLINSPYTLNGKMVCNASLDIHMTGTYGSAVVTGYGKLSYGIAGTIDDSSASKSAKFILSVAVNASLNAESIPVTATLYVYNATTDEPIGTKTLTEADLAGVMPIAHP